MTHVLEIDQLIKTYTAPDGGETPVINVPRFFMEAGAQVALSGRSGSGKTTLLNLIAGIQRPDGGTVRVAGQPMTDVGEAQRDRLRAKAIGYVFQTFNLLQGYSALENVILGMVFGRGPDPGFARALLEKVGLANRLDYKPSQLSIGQQQRVAVARALANHPALVLADEPTGNLDAAHAGEALELIRDLCGENGAALLLVSHDRDVLNQFDTVQDLAWINRARERSGDAP